MANGIDKYNFERMSSRILREDCVYNGTKYVSMYQAVLAAGVSYEMVRRRMAERMDDGNPRWTLQQAIDAPKYARAPLSTAGSAVQAIRTLLYSGTKLDDHGVLMEIADILDKYDIYLQEQERVQNKS